MKRRSIFSLLPLFAFAACSQQAVVQEQSTIRGSFPNDVDYNGKHVYLYENSTQRRVLLDSALVEAGKFAFAPRSLDSLGLYVVQADGVGSLSVILDSTDIELDLKGRSIKGGLLNRIASERDAEMKVYMDSMYTAYAELDETDPDLKIKQQALLKEVSDYERTLGEEILRKHPENALGVRAMYALLLADDVTKERIEELKAQASSVVVSHPAVQRIFQFHANQEHTSAGKPFVDVKGIDDEGKEVSLSDYVGRGHYVLVDFWASWCGPCRRSMPELKKLLAEFGGDGLQIVGLAVWDKMDAHKKAVEELELPWAQIFNENEATEIYGVRGIPHLMLIAPDGTIVARGLEAGDELRKLLQEEKSKNGGKL